MYDCLVVIGRFAPCDNGHVARLRAMAGQARQLIVLVSDADLAPSSRMPWTAAERAALLKAGLGDDAARIVFGQALSHTYGPAAWAAEVGRQFADIRSAEGDGEGRIAVMARPADVRPQALAALPSSWERLAVPAAPDGVLQGEALVEHMFEQDWAVVRAQVPEAVLDILEAFAATAVFADLAEEYRYVAGYKASWSAAPYPPILVSVDTVIVCAGHVLLIRRGGIPGKGLWALPGGFLEQDETVLASALRELREETQLSLSDETARSALRKAYVFDDPGRSSRGRVITHGFHFELPGKALPDVTGSDDAERAVWVPLAQLSRMRASLFEDHASILEFFLGAF